MAANCNFLHSLLMACVLAMLCVGASCGKVPRTRVLSEEPRIEMRSKVLIDGEISTIRTLADEIGMQSVDLMKEYVSGGEDYAILNETEESWDFESSDATAAWGVVGRLEAVATEWARSWWRTPDAPNASTIVTRWESWSPSMALNRSGLLHLDNRRNRWRRGTMLVYMSGNCKADDGYTVFPCVETDDMEAREARRRSKICSRAMRHVKAAHQKLLDIRERGLHLSPEDQGHYMMKHPELGALAAADEDGVRPVDWRWTPEQDAVMDQPDVPRVDALSALAEAMCRGKATGLRIAPTAGDAVFFEGAVVDRKGGLVPDWRLWHAGCSPRHGRRWTAQVFLEDRVPISGRREAKVQVARSDSCDRADGSSSQCSDKRDK